ncbi:hypothetical protein FD754_024245 [Muntiacus muntjak]|uniref:Ig-like domain-containing protein n=1 Tax=Muntiacus muntjak TaxID=9888 RepID=A0A5N3UQD6_MUNMU|nr:hypothetical protein FD754_024245 [Muntiacus muntjak]
MLRAPALLLVFLALVTQVSSNMEDDRMSITRATGSSAVIPCDLPTQSIQYIHWYKFQEGTVPRRLLYYDVSSSKVVLEPGISPGKYHGYEGTDRMYKFVISNLQESDSGAYRCALIAHPPTFIFNWKYLGELGKFGNRTVVQCLTVCLGMQGTCVLEQLHLHVAPNTMNTNIGMKAENVPSLTQKCIPEWSSYFFLRIPQLGQVLGSSYFCNCREEGIG